MNPKFGDRVKDLRPRDYGEGVIEGYFNDGHSEYWSIRWDDSGLYNEELIPTEFEVIETRYCQCGHNDDAHFDGNLKYQACLHEWCICPKYETRKS